jgi:hypothetical protein
MRTQSAALVAILVALSGTAAALWSGTPLSAQAPQSRPPDALIAKLLENRYGLSVRDGQLSGGGTPVLQSAIEQSRFVLLGEEHGTAQTPELQAAVCRAAAPVGFHTLAVEEGPLLAAELEAMARRPDGPAQLAAFETKFPSALGVSRTREDFDMLQQCARASQSEFRLWGLNHESWGSAGLMLSRLLTTQMGNNARAAVQQLLQKNDDASRKAMQTGNPFDLFMIAADDEELAATRPLLDEDGSAAARSLFASFVESHQINRRSPAEYGNARRRERLMKTLFAVDYAEATRGSAAPPKVLLKFGAFHVYRGLNPVRGSGIGNYLAEFAEGQGAQSLHMYLMPVKGSQPIYPKVGEPAQLISFDHEAEPTSRYLQPLFSNLLSSGWTMFDLRPLRQDRGLRGALTPELATLVYGIDILVMVPEGRPSTDIRQK